MFWQWGTPQVVLFTAAVVVAALTAIASASSTVSPDQALARRMNLRLSDFDTGWTSHPHAGTSSPCRIGNRAGPYTKAQSPAFHDDLADYANSETAVFRTDTNARRAYGILLSSTMISCEKRVLKQHMQGVSAARMSFKPNCARLACPYLTGAWRFTGTVVSGGTRLPFVLEWIVARRGRGVAVFLFTGYRSFGGDDEALVDAAMERGSG